MNLRGFTLIEVMVAVALTGMIVWTVGPLFSSATSIVSRLDRARTDLDQSMNAVRWTQEALAAVAVGGPGDFPFVGGPKEMRFTAWLALPDGWPTQEEVHLIRKGPVVIGEVGSRIISLWPGAASLDIDYLLVPGEASRWVDRWESPLGAPAAVRLRIGRLGARETDTLLFGLRGRG